MQDLESRKSVFAALNSGAHYSQIAQSLRQAGYNGPKPKFTPPPAPQDEGFLSGAWEKTKQTFGEGWERIEDAAMRKPEALGGTGEYNFGQSAVRGAAGALQMATAPVAGLIGQAVSEGMEMISPESKKEIGQTVAPAVSSIKSWYDTLPEGAKQDLKDAGVAIEVLSNLVGGKAAEKGLEVAAEGAEMAGRGAGTLAKTAGEAFKTGVGAAEDVIETGVEKAAGKVIGSGDGTKELFQATSPSYNVLAKSKDIGKIKAKAKDADIAVVEAGYAPKNTSERVEAYLKTREDLWNKVEQARGGATGTFDATKLADEIEAKIAQLSVKGKIDPALDADIKALRDKVEYFRGIGEVNAKELGTIRAQINAQTDWGQTKLYGDTFDSVMKSVAGTVRQAEDELIGALADDSTVGAILRKYGAVTGMLEDVVKQDIKALRKKGLGLEETFSRIEGLGDVAKGVIGLVSSPGKGIADIAGGTAKVALGKVAGKIKDPDYLIRTGYEKLAKSLKSTPEPGFEAGAVAGKADEALEGAEAAAKTAEMPAPSVPATGPKVPGISQQRPNRRRAGGSETTRRPTRGMQGQRPGQETITKQRVGERRPAREGGFQEGAPAPKIPGKSVPTKEFLESNSWKGTPEEIAEYKGAEKHRYFAEKDGKISEISLDEAKSGKVSGEVYVLQKNREITKLRENPPKVSEKAEELKLGPGGRELVGKGLRKNLDEAGIGKDTAKTVEDVEKLPQFEQFRREVLEADPDGDFAREYNTNKNFGPKEKEQFVKLYSHVQKNKEAILKEYEETWGNVINTDEFRNYLGGQRGVLASTNHELASYLGKEYLKRKLLSLPEGQKMPDGLTEEAAKAYAKEQNKQAKRAFVFLGGGGGSGKSGTQALAVKLHPDAVILDGTFDNWKKGASKIEEAMSYGFKPILAYTHRDFSGAMKGILQRTISQAGKGMYGRTVKYSTASHAHSGARDAAMNAYESLFDRFKDSGLEVQILKRRNDAEMTEVLPTQAKKIFEGDAIPKEAPKWYKGLVNLAVKNKDIDEDTAKNLLSGLAYASVMGAVLSQMFAGNKEAKKEA